MASVGWNYTTILNIVFLLVAALLLWRYFRGGGWQMLRTMNKPINATDEHHDQHGNHHRGAGHRLGEAAAPAWASPLLPTNRGERRSDEFASV